MQELESRECAIARREAAIKVQELQVAEEARDAR